MKQRILLFFLVIFCTHSMWSADYYSFKHKTVDEVELTINVFFEDGHAEIVKASSAWSLYSSHPNTIDFCIPSEVDGHIITVIGDEAFKECYWLKSITVPNTVTSIGIKAFYYCGSLTNAVLSDNVETLGSNSFGLCSNLLTVTFGKGMKTVGADAFSCCDKMEGVYISDLKAWCDISFEGSYITNPLKNANHLFLNGEEIKELVIPDGVTSIKDQAFWGGESIESISIPEGVTSIGRLAFAGCIKARTVSLPSTLESISWGAFSADSLIKTICLPKSCIQIEDFAFDSCRGLTSLYVEWLTPPAITNYTFYGCSNAVLYVPFGCKIAYKTAEYWKDFKEIVETEPEITEKCDAPTISYDRGAIVLKSETEGAVCHLNISAADDGLGLHSPVNGRIELMPTYTITAWATAEGYTDSDRVTATIRWRDGRPVLEGFSSVKLRMEQAADVNGDDAVGIGDIVTITNVMAGDVN